MKWKHISLSLALLSSTLLAEEKLPTAILDLDTLPKNGETLIWSPLFQASWDKLNTHLGGNPEATEPPNTLIDKLDSFEWSEKTVLPEDNYLVEAGPATQAFRDSFAAKVKDKFNVEVAPSRITNTPERYATYGFLMSDVKYVRPFFASKSASLKFHSNNKTSSNVFFFGTAGQNSGNYAKHVDILSYSEKNNTFILSFDTQNKKQNVIIYLPEKAVSFQTAIQDVLNTKKSPLGGKKLFDPNYPKLRADDTLKIPKLNINSDTEFASQLRGMRYFPHKKNSYGVTRAYQITHFQLDSKGARVKVETGADIFGGSPHPRNFICDRPFFVFLWQDEAEYPYFMSWIGSSQGMQKAK